MNYIVNKKPSVLSLLYPHHEWRGFTSERIKGEEVKVKKIMNELKDQFGELKLISSKSLNQDINILKYKDNYSFFATSQTLQDISRDNPEFEIKLRFKDLDLNYCGIHEFKDGKIIKQIERNVSEQYGVKINISLEKIICDEEFCDIPLILTKQINPNKFDDKVKKYDLIFSVNSFALNDLNIFDYVVSDSYKIGQNNFELIGDEKVLEMLYADKNPFFINQTEDIFKCIKKNFEHIKTIVEYQILNKGLENNTKKQKPKI